MMNSSSRKWIITKLSSIILIPLMIWFLITFNSIQTFDYETVIDLVARVHFKILFSILVCIALIFFTLTISEIFEDYIKSDIIKNVANKSLAIFGIVFSIFTIIMLYN